MVTVKVIIPDKLLADSKAMDGAIKNAIEMATTAAKVDFEVTTQTWSHSVNFRKEKGATSGKVWTDDEVYSWVNNGTKPHVIVPRRAARLVFAAGGFRAKTSPGKIKSRQGSKGKGIVFAKRVQHPGTEPRNFDKEIQSKWEKEFPAIAQRAIDSAI